MTRGLKKWATHVGNKIKDFREKAEMTQTDLAKKAGLPQSHISRLENAEHTPTNLTLVKIAPKPAPASRVGVTLILVRIDSPRQPATDTLHNSVGPVNLLALRSANPN